MLSSTVEGHNLIILQSNRWGSQPYYPPVQPLRSQPYYPPVQQLRSQPYYSPVQPLMSQPYYSPVQSLRVTTLLSSSPTVEGHNLIILQFNRWGSLPYYAPVQPLRVIILQFNRWGSQPYYPSVQPLRSQLYALVQPLRSQLYAPVQPLRVTTLLSSSPTVEGHKRSLSSSTIRDSNHNLTVPNCRRWRLQYYCTSAYR